MKPQSMSAPLGQFVFIKNAFDESFCESVVSLLEENREVFVHHNWKSTYSERKVQLELDPEIAGVQNESLDTPRGRKLFRKIDDAVNRCTLEYYSQVGQDMLEMKWVVSAISSLRFNRYDESSTMAYHVDHIKTLFTQPTTDIQLQPSQVGIPVLTYLHIWNDDYEGGDLLIGSDKLPTKAGDVIIFPSVFLYPHMVTPVTKGVRYSSVQWAW